MPRYIENFRGNLQFPGGIPPPPGNMPRRNTGPAPCYDVVLSMRPAAVTIAGCRVPDNNHRVLYILHRCFILFTTFIEFKIN